jgi:hypothetical protein
MLSIELIFFQVQNVISNCIPHQEVSSLSTLEIYYGI